VATEQAALEAETQRIRVEAFRLNLDQNASNAVLGRRHQSCLPSQFEGRNPFNTPGAGTSNPPGVTRAAEAPVTGAAAQTRVPDPPRMDLTLPQRVPTPSGHYSNPLDNMIDAAS
jgi:hypothetical protein